MQGQLYERWVSFCKSVDAGCRASYRSGGSAFVQVLMVAAGPAIGEVGQLLSPVELGLLTLLASLLWSGFTAVIKIAQVSAKFKRKIFKLINNIQLCKNSLKSVENIVLYTNGVK